MLTYTTYHPIMSRCRSAGNVFVCVSVTLHLSGHADNFSGYADNFQYFKNLCVRGFAKRILAFIAI